MIESERKEHMRASHLTRHSVYYIHRILARRDELWAGVLTCGGLSIRLPPVYGARTTAENRQHRCAARRYAGQDAICPRTL